MKNIKAITLIGLLCLGGQAFAQDHAVHISISPVFGAVPVNLTDSVYKTEDTNNLQIDVLRFYISNIRFLKDGAAVLVEKNSFHLVDAADGKTLSISVENKEGIVFDEVKFDVGIDSTTNVAGVMGGDLDPTKGMYWAWQSGYINFKLEGKSNLCHTRNNEFQFHLGGYLPPFYCLQTVRLPVRNAREIKIRLDIQQILGKVDLATVNHILSPGKEAVSFAGIVANSFKIIDSEN